MEHNEHGLKKKLRLIAKNNAFKVAHVITIRRLKKFMKNSSSPPPVKKGGKRILFNMIYGMYGHLMYWETFLAKAMQLRGHDVRVIICGKALTMCTSEYTVDSIHNDKTCKHCIKYSQDFLKTMGIPYLNMADLISDEEIQKIKEKVGKLTLEECKKFHYKGVDAGGLSINAAMRYFEGTVNIDEKLNEEVLRSELTNTIIAIDVAEKIKKESNPDSIVTTHLGYSAWGGLAEYFEAQGTRVCYPGNGYKVDTIQFDISLKERVNQFFSEFKKHRKNKPLDKKEEDELDGFIHRRIEGQEGDTTLYGYENRDVSAQFDLDKYDKTFACFPNVAWDSSLLKAHRGFKDAYEWVSYVVEYFKKHPNLQLIMKIHPAEEYSAFSKETIKDYIQKHHSPLTDNIKIIPPVTKISPYSLFPFIDAGLVYNGTVGLEMSLHKVPVVVSGITHYGQNGFTYDVPSKEKFDEILSQDLSRLDKDKQKMARLYGYFYFVKSFVPFKYVYSKGFLKKGWNIKSFDEIKEGKDKLLDRVCEYMADDIFYQNW